MTGRSVPILPQLRFRLSLDGDLPFLRNLLLGLLRDGQAQDAVLQLCRDILFRQRLANIEASLKRPVKAFLPDHLPLPRLILFYFLRSRNGQAAVLQAELDLILVETGKVDVHLEVILMLMNICFHKTLRMSSI